MTSGHREPRPTQHARPASMKTRSISDYQPPNLNRALTRPASPKSNPKTSAKLPSSRTPEHHKLGSQQSAGNGGWAEGRTWPAGAFR